MSLERENGLKNPGQIVDFDRVSKWNEARKAKKGQAKNFHVFSSTDSMTREFVN